jgi:hypothetical protein
VGHRHVGLGSTAPGKAVQSLFEPKPKFKRDEIDFKLLHTLTASNRTFPGSKKLKQIMVGKYLR